MSKPYFTIYCPFHNSEYAESAQVALASLEMQSFMSFETIVVANGMAIPDWMNSKRFMIDTEGLGGRKIIAGRFGTLAGAANAAMKVANGEWIIRLDADDEFLEEALWDYARSIEEGKKTAKNLAVQGHWEGEEVMGGGLALPVGLLRSCNGYDEQIPLKDGNLIIQKLELRRDCILKTARPVYRYHKHAGSMTCP